MGGLATDGPGRRNRRPPNAAPTFVSPAFTCAAGPTRSPAPSSRRWPAATTWTATGSWTSRRSAGGRATWPAPRWLPPRGSKMAPTRVRRAPWPTSSAPRPRPPAGRIEVAAAHVEAAAPGLGDRATLDAILAGIATRADLAVGAGGAPRTARRRPGTALDGCCLRRRLPTGPAATPAFALRRARRPRRGPADPIAAGWRSSARRPSARPCSSPSPCAPTAPPPRRSSPRSTQRSRGRPTAAAFAFVRAEALRAAGRHEEARIAYASAERLALAPAEAGAPRSPQ